MCVCVTHITDGITSTFISVKLCAQTPKHTSGQRPHWRGKSPSFHISLDLELVVVPCCVTEYKSLMEVGRRGIRFQEILFPDKTTFVDQRWPLSATLATEGVH